MHTDDLRGSLRMLTRRCPVAGGRPACGCPIVVRAPELEPPAFDGPGVRYRDAMAVLDASCPTGWTSSSTPATPARRRSTTCRCGAGGRFAVALGMGGMGYSFGAGIGMAFGRVNSRAAGGRTVVIAGDGAFFMHGMEVHTAVHYRLPVTFVLFNNNAHAMCVTREQLFYDDLYSYNRFRPSQLGGRPGRDVPRPDRPSTSATSTGWPRRCALRWTSTARRWSASNAPPTKSRRSHRFLPCRPRNVLPIKRFQQHRRTAPMSLPALDDITHTGTTDPIDGVMRIETAPVEKATPIILEKMRSVYPHEEVFGRYCTVNDYIDCPPDELFDYLADTRSLEEWTYSLRGFTPTDEPGLWLAYDRLRPETRSTPARWPTRRRAPSTTTAPGTRASTCG